jgi:CheY-like chemotaxis protein/DNA-directed RNA polymerase specialized sigma24 family protein
MNLSDLIARQIPYLRRYARALTGSQSLGDGLVREVLEAMLVDAELRAQTAASRLPLYAAFSKIYASAGAALAPATAEGPPEAATAASRLERVTPLARQALLLEAMEDFSLPEIAQILDCDEEEVREMIDTSVAQIEEGGQCDVLIIEDEPLIAYQLEMLVTGLGNNVVGIAKTRDEAVTLFAQTRPGLVLADIQLADGSSGIDAVNAILDQFDIPVIFITAFPERLLTGERPEPTFLITKPFSDDYVRATIGQVMFFGSVAPIG